MELPPYPDYAHYPSPAGRPAPGSLPHQPTLDPVEVLYDPASPPSPLLPTPDFAYDPEGDVVKAAPGVTMEWSEVSFVVTVKRNKEKVDKHLLSRVHGRARPGQILAIMGGSGAGKTTLLDALAGRLHGRLTGTLRINGNALPPGSSGGYSKAYVFQGDNLYACLTVRETLMFSARFQLSHLTSTERKEVVERWLVLLGMKDIENVRVGDEDQKGISGGQRRRLSIGVDLLKDPKVIFLDEPISGLDSTSAFKVVKAIRDLTVEDSRTVLMTIHQPSPRILELLGNILILSEGKVVFQGRETDIERYLLLGAKVRMPDHVSPVEFFLDFIDELKESGAGGIDALADYHEEEANTEAVEAVQDAPVPAKHRKSHLKDYVTLCHRSGLIMLRIPELFFARLVFCAMSGFLFSTIFWRLGRTFADANSFVGAFLMGTANLTFTSVEVMPLFASERTIIRREYFQQAYSVGHYILAQSTVWTVSLIPASLLWTLCSYWVVGMDTDINGAATFAFAWFMWFCIMFAANAFAMMMSAVIESPMTSSSTSTAAYAFMLLLAGFFVPRSNIPPYWIWFHYISHFKYAIYGLASNYFSNMVNTRWGCPPPQTNNPQCSLSSDDILAYYDINGWDKWASIGALIGLGLAWRIIHCVVLWLRFRKLRIDT